MVSMFQNLSDFLGGEEVLYFGEEKKKKKTSKFKKTASAAFQGDEIIYLKLGKNLWTLRYLWNNVRRI